VEYKSYIKIYKNLKIKNLKFKIVKIVKIENKGQTKDFKRKNYLSGFYSNRNNIKIKFI